MKARNNQPLITAAFKYLAEKFDITPAQVNDLEHEKIRNLGIHILKEIFNQSASAISGAVNMSTANVYILAKKAKDMIDEDPELEKIVADVQKDPEVLKALASNEPSADTGADKKAAGKKTGKGKKAASAKKKVGRKAGRKTAAEKPAATGPKIPDHLVSPKEINIYLMWAYGPSASLVSILAQKLGCTKDDVHLAIGKVSAMLKEAGLHNGLPDEVAQYLIIQQGH